MALALNDCADVVRDINGIRSELHQVYEKAQSSHADFDLETTVRALVKDIMDACTVHREAALSTVLLKESEENYSVVHAIDVAIIVFLSGKLMDIKTEVIESLMCAALTMNLSMAKLQDFLFSHQGELTDAMRQDILLHPKASENMLRRSGIKDNLWLDAVKNHHELQDGTGYPAGIRGKALSVGTRILSTADHYAALVSPRRHRQGFSPDKAIVKLFTERSKYIESNLSIVFFGILTSYPPGTLLKLNTKKDAVVLKYDSDEPSPNLYVCYVEGIENGNAPTTNVELIDTLRIEKVLRPSYQSHRQRLQEIWSHSWELESKGDFKPDPLLLDNGKRVLEKMKLPVYPKVLSELQNEVAKLEPSVDKIAALVAKDISLSGEVLRLVSSGVYAPGQEINSIPHAVMILGLSHFKRAVLSSAYLTAIETSEGITDTFLEETMAMAKCCSNVASIVEEVSPDLAYMAGLFSGSGCLLLDQVDKGYLGSKVPSAYIRPFSMIEVENITYSTNHCVLGYLLCEQWQVPEEVCQAIYLHHHRDFKNIEEKSVRTLIAILAVAAHIVSKQFHAELQNSSESDQQLADAIAELLIQESDIENIKLDLLDELHI